MRFSLAFAFVASSIAGCTLILPFDEIPPDGVAEAGAPDATAPDVSVKDAPDAAIDAPFPPPCDPSFPIVDVDCAGAKLPICSNRLATYPPGQDRTNDLVICNASAKATCVQHCPAGCAAMPAGFPDQCDDCAGRADGYYCGRDLRGWIAADDDVAVQCEGGRTLRGALCGTNKCASACPRSDGPMPSCCIP